MQDRVQAAVLRAVEADSVIHPEVVRRLLPRTDVRDLQGAIDVLVAGGFIVFLTPDADYAGVLPVMALTDTGRARLAAEHSW